ncbi:MAG: hypothetical protein LDL33_06100 [Desulfomonile sp.]|nr:hypothetical protein [Desulfomonile sp.]
MKLWRLVACVLGVVLIIGGCAGKATRTGCATATRVGCDGRVKLSYADGKAAVKQLDPDSLPKAARVTAQNLFAPARFVETTQGSTLTFPSGDTVVYFDKECPEGLGRQTP